MSTYCMLFALVLCCFSTVRTQTVLEAKNNATLTPAFPPIEESPEESYPNVLALKYHLMYSRIPRLLTKISLSEIKCPIKQCNISLFYILDAIQFDKFNSVDIANAIEVMNITARDAYNIILIYNLSVPYIEDVLKKADVTFSEIYKYLVDSLSDPPNTIPRILEILNVSSTDFTNAQVYGNDTTRLTVLSTGNYSFENIQALFNYTNTTFTHLLKSLPLNKIFRNLPNFDSMRFKNFVKNLGITSLHLEEFYKYLNVTSIDFIAYPGYAQILTDFETHLNPEAALATVVSKNTLVTSNKVKSLITFQSDNSDFVQNYSYYQAENIQNPVIHYHIKSVALLNQEYKADDIAFIETYNPYKNNITELFGAPNKTSFVNCTYVTLLPFGEIYSENFSKIADLNGHRLTISKSADTVYNLGSPLFCLGKLVAIATQETATDIWFSTFIKKSTSQASSSTVKNTTPLPGTSSKPGVGSIKHVNIMCVISAIIIRVVLV